MLDNLRNFATTLPGKILGVFLLIGLAGFGISGVISNVGTNTVAWVGDREISALEFDRAYRSRVNSIGQQTGQVPTGDQALQMGVPTSVIQQLATQEAMNALGERFGLGVTDDRIAEALRDDPSFSGTLGSFDRARFEQVLRQMGYTESEFFQSRREAAQRQQLAIALFGEVPVPDTVQQLARKFGSDRRVLDYVVLSEDSLLPISEPTEDELRSYIEENQAQYRTQPTRLVDLMVLTPETLAGSVEIPEAEIVAEYDSSPDRFSTVERRTISQVQVSDEGVAAAFEEGAEAGTPFEDVLADTGLSATELGTRSQAEMTDSNLAEAAFSLEEGAYTVIAGAQGQRVVHVSEIEPASQMSLEEARDDIESELRRDAAEDQYIDVLDMIEEQRAAFVSLDEIAAEAGLDVRELAVTQSGDALTELAVLDEADAGQITQAIFDAEMGQLAPSVALSANETVWFDLREIQEARDLTLDEARDRVAADWMAERRQEALAQRAEEFVAALQDGQEFETLAVNNNLTPQTSQPIGRQGGGGGAITQAVAQAAYEGGEGHIGMARNNAGSYVVFRVAEVQSADDGELQEQQSQAMGESYRNDLYSSFASSLRSEYGLRINQSVLRQVIGLDQQNQGL